MTKKKMAGVERIKTGVRNLDQLFRGGVPQGSVVVISGAPGGGKTILAQQIGFHTASTGQPVLYFSTLSEPTAKTLRYLSQFSFFDAGKLDAGLIRFIDLGSILRTKSLEEASKQIMTQVRKVKPALVVIDSFRVFDDLASSNVERRRFGYELAVNLMAWEATTVLIGEYGPDDISTSPLFSVVDGLMVVTQRERFGEQQRFLQIVKLRGTEHSREEHSFVITAAGIEVFAPRITIQRQDPKPLGERCKTGISKLDELLGEGIPRGSSLLVAGVAGTGKTVLLLEFLYRGARAGEKGIIFSFEETRERLLTTARGLGWDIDREIDSGMIEIVFISQPDVLVEQHLQMMCEYIERTGARRVAVDSVSVFLHKVSDPQIDRERVFQLATIIQNLQAVGFFATDIPYGSTRLSRFGVEETVVDGVILLTSTQEGFERQRYIEIYKLRNTAHLKGRHSMVVASGGISVFPRYAAEDEAPRPPPSMEMSRRLASGVPGLDALCGGGLLEGSVTLVSGSAGIGKTTLALQFILEGARRQEPGLYLALEEGPAQLRKSAEVLGLPLQQAIGQGLVEIIYLSSEHVRPCQLRALLYDRIRTQQTRRLVFDSVSYLVRDASAPLGPRRLLHAMALRLKAYGVTSILTLESDSMYSTDSASELGYSPVVDNILLLRYERRRGEIQPTVAVVKTRGSAHDRGTFRFSIADGGIAIGERSKHILRPRVNKGSSSRKP